MWDITAEKVLFQQSHVASDESGVTELDLGRRYNQREQRGQYDVEQHGLGERAGC